MVEHLPDPLRMPRVDTVQAAGELIRIFPYGPARILLRTDAGPLVQRTETAASRLLRPEPGPGGRHYRTAPMERPRTSHFCPYQPSTTTGRAASVPAADIFAYHSPCADMNSIM